MIVIRTRQSIYAILFCHHRNKPLPDCDGRLPLGSFTFSMFSSLTKKEPVVEGFAHYVHMTMGDLSGVRVSLITEVRNSCRACMCWADRGK